MAAPRVLVYSHEDIPLFELDPQELYGLTLAESINGEHALSVTTAQELEKGQRIIVEHGGRWKEFVVAGIEAEHGSYECAVATYYCPWSLQHDLSVAYIKNRRVGDSEHLRGAADAIGMVASATERWGVGTIANTSYSSGWFYYTTAWDALSRVASQWSGEVDATIVMSDRIERFIDFYDEQGVRIASRRFDYGADITSITRTVMDDAFVCRIVPRGKGEQVEGDSEAYGRRITIESVNGGKDYLEDAEIAPLVRLPDGRGGYEYPTALVIYEEIEKPAELLAAAQRDLERYTRPKVGYAVEVAAFADESMGWAEVALGDAVQVVDRTFCEGGLRIEARAVGIQHNLLDPALGKLTVGNFLPSTADAIKQLERSTASMAESVIDASGKAGAALDTAGAAQAVANAVNQHFWEDTDGAHVTEVTKDEWSDPTNPKHRSGANSIWNSLGMLIRKGLNNLLSITEGAITFFDGNGNAAENIMAYFGSTSARIGYEGQGNITIDTDSIDFNEGGETVAQVVNGTLAGIVIPNSGDFVGGTNEPGLWIRPTNSDARVAIGAGGKITNAVLQIVSGLAYIRGTASPSSITLEENGNITTQAVGSGQTGHITAGGEFRKTTDIDLATIPTSNKYRNILVAADSGGNTLSYLQATQDTLNIMGLNINTMRVVGGSPVYNGISLRISKDGGRSVALSEPKAWNDALRVQLYQNDSGSNGTITLSQSAANFNHLTIYYRDNDNETNSVDVYQPNGKMVALASYHPGYNNGALYLKTRSVTINGTTISTTSLNRYSQVAIEPAMTAQKNNLIYITRVEGW